MELEMTSPKIAEAICYLFCVAPAEFDPDGDLTAAFWPHTIEEYEPGKTKAENVAKAIAALATATGEL